MPRVASGKVLITGASGYIATWIVKEFLDAGFIVRGTVRSTSKGQALKELFKTERFEYVIVEDILNDASFDEGVKDVDAVVHTASPLSGPEHPPDVDPDEFIKPAVNGTVGILKSVIRAGNHVKRVVILSSFAAIKDAGNHPQVFDEKHWATTSVNITKEQGKSAPNLAKYAASKTLAEKAAWEFYNLVKNTVKWDLVAINPSFVLGPIIEPFPTTEASKITGPNFFIWAALHGKPTSPNLDFWVDVRDVAEAHLKAVTIEEAGNQRFLLVSEPLIAQDLLDAVHEDDPTGEFDSLARGTPGSGKNIKPPPIVFSTKQSQEILGIKYRTIRDSAKDFGRTVLNRV